MNITLKVASNQVLRELGNQTDLNELDAIASKYLERVKCYSQPKSLKGRVQEYKLMRETAKAITDKIHQSRTWVQWFLSWFGVGVGQSECDLLQAQKELTVLITRSQIQEAELWLPPNSPKIPFAESDWLIHLHYKLYGVDLYDKRIKPHMDEVHLSNRKVITDHEARALNDPAAEVKMAAFTLCGTNVLNGSSVEGMSSYSGLFSYRKQLKEFLEENKTRLTLEQKSRAEDILKKLDYTLKISEKIELIKAFNKPQLFEELAFEIASDIQNLDPNDSIILPGGYRTTSGGHATLFEFERNQNDKYSFNIINTGDGALNFAGFGDFVAAIVNNKVQDYKTSGHSLQKMANTDLIKELLMNASVNKNGSIDKMFEPIVRHFLNDNPKLIEKGKTHFLQTNGTCAFDCVVAWAEGEMGETLAKLFELFRVNNELRKLNAIKERSVKDLQATIPGLFDGKQLKGMELINKLKEWGVKKFNDLKSQLSGNVGSKDRVQSKVLEEQRAKLNRAQRFKGSNTLQSIEAKIQQTSESLNVLKQKAVPLEKAHAEKLAATLREPEEPLKSLRIQHAAFKKELTKLEKEREAFIKAEGDEKEASASLKKAEAKIRKYRAVEAILSAV